MECYSLSLSLCLIVAISGIVLHANKSSHEAHNIKYSVGVVFISLSSILQPEQFFLFTILISNQDLHSISLCCDYYNVLGGSRPAANPRYLKSGHLASFF
jgi:hypothetical protein